MRRSENGTVVYDPDGAADASRYDGKQFGWYVQGIYQFVQRWRVGLRYDRLNANNSVANAVAGTSLPTLADDGDHPQRVSEIGRASSRGRGVRTCRSRWFTLP